MSLVVAVQVHEIHLVTSSFAIVFHVSLLKLPILLSRIMKIKIILSLLFLSLSLTLVDSSILVSNNSLSVLSRSF